MLAWARPAAPHCGVTTSSNLRSRSHAGLRRCDPSEPGLGAQATCTAELGPKHGEAARSRRLLRAVRALWRFTRGRTMKAAALRRAATILALKGGTCVRSPWATACSYRLSSTAGRTCEQGMAFYQLLHTMACSDPRLPSTIRAFGTIGQLSPAQLIVGTQSPAAQFATCSSPTCRTPTGARSHDTAEPGLNLGCFLAGSRTHHSGCLAALQPEVAAAGNSAC